MENYKFVGGPKSSKTIIRYLQETDPKYAEYNAAKSFFYTALIKFKKRVLTPEFDPFRDRRGENRPSSKRKNPEIIQLVDELLSDEDTTTAPSGIGDIRTQCFSLHHLPDCPRPLLPMAKAMVHGRPHPCTKI